MKLRAAALRTKIDRLWGIERHPDSELFGQVATPIIVLWDNPFRRHYAVAVAEHAEPCVILERYDHPEEGRAYFRVQPGRAEWVGWGRRLRGFVERTRPGGWVSAPFLFTRGQKEVRGIL